MIPMNEWIDNQSDFEIDFEDDMEMLKITVELDSKPIYNVSGDGVRLFSVLYEYMNREVEFRLNDTPELKRHEPEYVGNLLNVFSLHGDFLKDYVVPIIDSLSYTFYFYKDGLCIVYETGGDKLLDVQL